jgi:hypothetical protein
VSHYNFAVKSSAPPSVPVHPGIFASNSADNKATDKMNFILKIFIIFRIYRDKKAREDISAHNGLQKKYFL